MDKGWAEKNKEIQKLLSKEASFGDAIKILIEFREELFQQITWIVEGYPEKAFYQMPFAGAKGYHSKTLAYSIWHIFRIEDIVAHEMIAEDEQILFREKYFKKTASPIITTGNELEGEEIAEFSKKLKLQELYLYAKTVKESSDKILLQLKYKDLKRKFTEDTKQKLKESKCVSENENASWLIDYWCGKDIKGLIQMPFSRHWIMHIEAMQRIKENLGDGVSGSFLIDKNEPITPSRGANTGLHLSFNDFHEVEAGNMPEYDEFCLLELKDGRYTAGKWHPSDYSDKNCISGVFGRGGFDTIDAGDVSKWHSFDRYNLARCLKEESTKAINIGEWIEDINKKAEFGGFYSIADGSFPKNKQYCLLVLKDGRMAGGRWEQWRDKKGGQFIYASALSSFSMKEVWAWTPLSPDDIFEKEEEREREKKHEEELNRNPSADPEKFKYGTDINVYYKMALKKLRKEYPWAKLAQMRKPEPYVIAPLHGQYVFGQEKGSFTNEKVIKEWTDGSTADEFVDFLCEYTKKAVINSNPEIKFSLGTDIEVYLEKAYENVKKEYRWLDKKTAEEYCQFEIKKVHGDLEFVKRYKDDKKYYVYDCSSAERFIEMAEHEYQRAAIEVNPVVDEYKVSFGSIEIHGWYLEKYVFYKLKTGDYKVSVQAGDRVTGGGRDFFITPYCFEAESYEEFLDRYLEIVPGGSFGLGKEDLLPDKKLKEFLGYK